MRKLYTLVFWLAPFLTFAQILDTASVLRRVDSLIQESRILAGQRDFDKALEINTSAEKIALEKLGNEAAAFGNCCNNRGRVLHAKGDYKAAEKWYFEALAIREKLLGRVHPDCAWVLNSLGLLYLDMGSYYEKTEPLFLEALDIREKTLGKTHKLYAASLTNIANIYYEMGNYDKAKPLLLEALAIRETMLGKESPDYTQSLNNLANLYETLGDYKNAETLHLEAIEIREKTMGKENSDYLQSLNNLSLLYINTGNFEKALPLCMEALSICEIVLGKEHPIYPWSLVNLGGLYRIMGNFEKAEPLLLEASAILEEVLGTQNPKFASSIENLALLYWDMTDYKNAEPLIVKLDGINQELIARAFHHLSEWELNNYLRTFSKSQAGLFSVAQSSPTEEKTIPQTCYDNCLFYKGFLLQAANQVKQLALSNSIAFEKFNQMNSYRTLLARQYALPINERNGIEVLESELNNIEKDITRTVTGYGKAMQQVKWQEVQQKLKPEEVAIEFVTYNFYSPKPTDCTMYTALLLRPGDSAPHFIHLFEEKSLDSLLQTQGERRAEYASNLYTFAEQGVKPPHSPQKSLYELLWKPLEKELAGVQTIYFSPSGLLHRLNIGAIPISEDETVADRYRLVELGSTRQLVIQSEVEVSNQEALLFGGIKYEMDSTAISQANDDLASETVASARGELSFTFADSTLRGGTWSYLKWTDKEVTTLEPILKSGGIKTTTNRGYAATEEAFKTIGRGKSSPRILHIATHGFFFPDPQSAIRHPQSNEPVFKLSDHPMIRSGLILAGGNHAWQTGKPIKPDMEDGILTAYEISQMNLSNTELVVLSACETGLGDIEGNEGVYGLQRAFKIAGVKYLIMSLWQVPDYQTQELMTMFYKKWLENNMTIPDAFRSAQREMREKYQVPYFWAGFVLVE